MTVNSELLKQVLIEQANKSIPTDYIPRIAFENEQSLKKSKEIIIISGIRRCGKSTLLQKIRHDEKEKDYYINFEDDRLIHFTVEDFQLLLEVWIELYGIQHTFYFDEIQIIPEWERFVRRLYEQNKKVYITGSNASMLSVELGTKLTGRHAQLTLYPYSFREIVNYQEPTLINKNGYSTQDIGKLKQLFSNYCRHGGIPDYVKFENKEYLHTLYEGILYRDIIVRYKLPNEKPIKDLSFYLASNVGKEFTFNALKKLIQVSSPSTVAEYCGYLENSYLCFTINRYSHSLKSQTHYGKKEYFNDHAIANAIGFRISEDKGRLLENIIFMELKRRYREIYFYQNKKECDFIVKEGYKIKLAIQVCVRLDTPEVKKREYAGLLEAMQEYELEEGLIITLDSQYQDQVELKNKIYKINIVPAWRWLLLI